MENQTFFIAFLLTLETLPSCYRLGGRDGSNDKEPLFFI